jgi:hypothetical protein
MYLVLSWRMKQLQAEGAGQNPLTFICLVPGYDRHFTLCEHLGIKMIAVPLLDSGPDMAAIENLVREDTPFAVSGAFPNTAILQVTLTRKTLSNASRHCPN